MKNFAYAFIAIFILGYFVTYSVSLRADFFGSGDSPLKTFDQTEVEKIQKTCELAKQNEKKTNWLSDWLTLELHTLLIEQVKVESLESINIILERSANAEVGEQLTILSQDNCESVANVLEAIKWQANLKTETPRPKLKFIISSIQSNAQNTDDTMNWRDLKSKNRTGYLKKLLKIEQRLKGDVEKRNEKNKIALSKIFSGVIDQDQLILFRQNLIKQKNSNPVFSNIEMINRASSDLKVLQQLHQLVERGQWIKAQFTCKDLAGPAENFHPDPTISLMLSQGRENTAALVKILRFEIDRYEKFMTDQFQNIEKQLAESL
jgi:hypothetical protein